MIRPYIILFSASLTGGALIYLAAVYAGAIATLAVFFAATGAVGYLAAILK